MSRALTVLLCALAACASFPPEPVKRAWGIGSEALWAIVGAIAGTLMNPVWWASALGAGIGWLLGDDIEQRERAEDAEEKAEELQRHLDQDTTSVERTILGTLESLGMWAWPLAIGTVAIIAWRFYAAGKKKALR